jgi:hypothetical protein
MEAALGNRRHVAASPPIAALASRRIGAGLRVGRNYNGVAIGGGVAVGMSARV